MGLKPLESYSMKNVPLVFCIRVDLGGLRMPVSRKSPGVRVNEVFFGKLNTVLKPKQAVAVIPVFCLYLISGDGRGQL